VTHFPIEAWANYARGAVDAEERSRLDEHLSACSRCARLLERLREFRPTLLADAEFYAVPDQVVRRAESLAAPAPARRLTFSADGVRISVDITSSSAGRRMLTGHIADAASAQPVQSRLAAHDQGSGAELATGVTDERGTFQLDCPAHVPIRLRIATIDAGLSLHVLIDPLG